MIKLTSGNETKGGLALTRLGNAFCDILNYATKELGLDLEEYKFSVFGLENKDESLPARIDLILIPKPVDDSKYIINNLGMIVPRPPNEYPKKTNRNAVLIRYYPDYSPKKRIEYKQGSSKLFFEEFGYEDEKRIKNSAVTRFGDTTEEFDKPDIDLEFRYIEKVCKRIENQKSTKNTVRLFHGSWIYVKLFEWDRD